MANVGTYHEELDWTDQVKNHPGALIPNEGGAHLPDQVSW